MFKNESGVELVLPLAREDVEEEPGQRSMKRVKKGSM